MRRPKLLIVAGIILLMAGCTDFFMICSLNPFYLDKDITLLPEVEGRWTAFPVRLKPAADQTDKREIPAVWSRADTLSTWRVERVILQEKSKNTRGKDTTISKPANYYLVKLTGNHPDSMDYRFRMVLFRVNRNLYADFMPVGNSSLENSRFAKESYFPVHTLARVRLLPDRRLDISWLGADYMKEMIEKKRVRVNYRWVGSASRLLLTGSSEQLTGLIDHYADEPRFIDWEKQPARLMLTRSNTGR